MNNNKTFALFIIISAFFIILLWRTNIKQPKEKVSDTFKQEEVIEDKEIEKEIKKEVGEYKLIEIPQEKKYDLIYENDNIKVEFDPYDALIKHAWVKDTFLNRKQVRLYDLVQPQLESGEGALRLKFGSWEHEKTLSNLTQGKDLYNYTRDGDTFIFKCSLKKKNEDIIYTIEKKFTFVDNEHLFKLDIKIYNNKNIQIDFDNTDIAYSIGWGPLLGIESRKEKVNKRQKNLFSYFNGKKIIEIQSNNKIFKQNGEKTLFATKYREGDNSWVASSGHYFASLIYPDDQNYKYFFDYRDKENKIFYCGFSRNTNNSRLKSTFYIYIGPKIASILKEYDNYKTDSFYLENIPKVRNKGMVLIGDIGDGIGWLLEFIYKGVKNYGLAIIILTILIKVVLFPLTYKSMASQQKMSKLQPQIKELQEKYKGKPDVLNKETMSLYKKQGINPLGGCLPMLLQMPILFAMYGLLNKMVALKGADFLWIKDLSQPDAVYNFGFNIPFVNVESLNILPILMAVVSLATSMLMPDTQSNQQAKMMMWAMPLVFFFMFYNMASGLVLYWTVMNILNLAQQFYMNNIKKKMKAA